MYYKSDNFPRGPSGPRQPQPFVLWLICSPFRLVGAAIGFLVGLVWGGIFTDLITQSANLEKYIKRKTNLRHLFLNDQKLSIMPTRTSHSHPTSASFRTAFNQYMNGLVTAAGYEPYTLSPSPTDQGKGFRLFYGEKDLATKYQNDDVTENSVIIMTDVDYYTDINEWMKFNVPILMYTFVPTKTAGRTADYSYRVIDGEVEFNVAGGARYRHPLWDYSGDTVSVIDKNRNLNVFNVEQRNIPGDPDHRFVVLTPMAQVPTTFMEWMTSDGGFKRRHLQGKNGVIHFYDPITDSLSVGRNGDWHSVNITGEVYAAISQRLQQKTSPPQTSDLERLLQASGDKKCAVHAPIMFNLMGLTLDRNIVLTNGTVNCYQPIGSLATEDGKPPGQQTSSPLVTEPALFPARGRCADEATISGRVTKMANPIVPPRNFTNYALEFVTKLVPTPAVGVPLSVAEVNERQNGPQQKARFNLVKDTLSMFFGANKLKAFIKAEAYANITDPRNITTMSSELTTLLSAYTYSFKEDCLKKENWYGPGCTPTQTIKRLRRLASSDLEWLCIDYSRLDGTVSEFLQRKIVMAAYTRWAGENSRADVMRLLNQVFVQHGMTETGLMFKPGYGTRSGSPITTDGNTMVCSYVVFAALRELGLSVDESWARIGLVYGDDGAQPNHPGLKEMLPVVAKRLGLKLKLDVVANGEPVPYLGRIFVDPRTSNDSFQDPMRTLAKLHLSGNKTVTPAQAAANKARGYLATDALTPLIGTWAKRVVSITGLKAKGTTHEEQFKMSNAWPQHDRDNILEAMAKVMDRPVAEILEMDSRLEEVDALDKFPVLLETVRAINIPAIVDGQVVGPGPSYTDVPTPSSTQTPQENDLKQTATHSELRALASKDSGSRRPNGEGPRDQGSELRKKVRSLWTRPSPGERQTRSSAPGRPGSGSDPRPRRSCRIPIGKPKSG
jgi:hypothetical protein